MPTSWVRLLLGRVGGYHQDRSHRVKVNTNDEEVLLFAVYWRSNDESLAAVYHPCAPGDCGGIGMRGLSREKGRIPNYAVAAELRLDSSLFEALPRALISVWNLPLLPTFIVVVFVIPFANATTAVESFPFSAFFPSLTQRVPLNNLSRIVWSTR